jgi:signal peptide peptidase SppA
MMTQTKIHAALAIDPIWAISRDYAIRQMPILAEVPAGQMQEKEDPSDYCQVVGSTAFIPVSGVMMKKPSSFGESCSTIKIERALRVAASSPSCQKIVMIFDSPGGQVTGTAELADAVNMARKKKEVVAFVDGECCSAAYWVASQCQQIVASPYSSVGSIGVYTVLYDTSAAAEAEGVQPILISSGGIKGQGVDGLPISEELTDEVRAMVMEHFDRFTAAVASGRSMAMDAVLSVADGRVWSSEKANEHGLVDKISTFDEFFESLSAPAKKTSNLPARKTMTLKERLFGRGAPPSEPETPVPTTNAENPLDVPVVRQFVGKTIFSIVDGGCAAGQIPVALKEDASNMLAQVIQAEGVGVGENGEVVFGSAFNAVTDYLAKAPSAELDKPKLSSLSGFGVIEPEAKTKTGSKAYAKAREKAKALAEKKRGGN